MLMVILGAGASYDSAQAYRPAYQGGSAQHPDEGGPWRPPLAKDLFRDRHHAFGSIVQKYDKLTHIFPYLREPSNGRSVEQVLESLQEQGRDNPERQRELASVRFYLCELLDRVTTEWLARTDRVTNYAPLIGEILRFNKPGEQVCLVTFNYDLLLENALYTFGFKPREPEEHLDSHPILKLFKLHGSVDWSRLVDTTPPGVRLQPQALIEQADSIQPSDKFVRANATNLNQMFGFAKPIIPAIAIPVQTKSDEYFECPRAHLNYLAEMLPHITKILIIGWQAKEAHFLRMLQSKVPNLRHVMVVGENEADAGRTLMHFSEEIGIRSDDFVGRGGFTDFIVKQEGHNLFRKS
ncbi:MAG: SIR2 family protein [Candidatus Acidiferrales bacterium]